MNYYLSSKPDSRPLHRTRPNLEFISLKGANWTNSREPNSVQGDIAEHYVKLWLMNTPGVAIVNEIPTQRRNRNGFLLTHQGSEIDVDLVYTYQARTYVCEVKSWGLNGASSKVPHIKSAADEVLQTKDTQVAVFFPIGKDDSRINSARAIEQAHPYAHCVDLGYKRKQLDSKTHAAMRQLKRSR